MTKRSCVLGLIAFLLGACGSSQSKKAIAPDLTPGTLRGVVTELTTGDSIPEVTIVLSRPGWDVAEMTNRSGAYRIVNILPAVYVARFFFGEMTCIEDVVVAANGETVLDMVLDAREIENHGGAGCPP